MEQLKPCPFCGKQPAMEQSRYLKGEIVASEYAVICGCSAFEGEYTDKPQAAQQWNYRPIEDTLRQSHDQLLEDAMEFAKYIFHGRMIKQFHVGGGGETFDFCLDCRSSNSQGGEVKHAKTCTVGKAAELIAAMESEGSDE